MEKDTNTTKIQEAAQRFALAAQRALSSLPAADAWALARHLGISPSANEVQARRLLSLQGTHAKLADASQQTYNDVLNGRRGSAGTVLTWCEAWIAYRFGDEATPLPALDYGEILGLPLGSRLEDVDRAGAA